MNRKSVMQSVLAAVLALLMPPALAHDFRHGDITIAHPFVRVDPVCDGNVTQAHVMLIVNQAKRADRLLAATLADGLRGTILNASGAGGGGSGPVSAVDLPPGGRVALMPPAFVITFPRPSKDLQKGAALPGSLHFENAGTASVSFMVEAVGEPGRACGAPGRPARNEKGHHHKH